MLVKLRMALMLKAVAKAERLMLAVLTVMAKAVAERVVLMLEMVMWQVVLMLKAVAPVVQIVRAKVAPVVQMVRAKVARGLLLLVGVALLGAGAILMQLPNKKTSVPLTVWITARLSFEPR